MPDRSVPQRHTMPEAVDYAALLEAVEEGVVVQDPTGVIRYINPRARALLRLGKAAVPFAPRLPWSGDESTQERAPGMPVHDVFDSGEPLVARVVGLGRGSERRWLSLSATPWWDGARADAEGEADAPGWQAPAAGRPDAVIVTLRDVTAVRRDRQRLARHARFRAGLVRLIEGSLQGNLDQGFHQRVLDAAVEVIPAAQAGTLALRQQDDAFAWVAAVGLDLEGLRQVRLVELPAAGDHARPRLVRRGQGAHLQPQGGTLRPERAAAAQPQVSLSVPVVLAGRTVAYLRLDNYDHPDAYPPEAVDLARILATLIGALWRSTRLDEERRAEQAQLAFGAYHDPITRLPNRALLQDRVDQAMAQSLRSGRPLALLFLDLDDFKALNEAHGQALGDQFLQQLGRRLRAQLRDVDTVARWGGDEFVVLLTNLRETADAARVAQKIVASLNQPLRIGPLELRTGVTIGIDVFPHQATTAEELMRHADMALYRAKLKSKNGWLFFTAALNEELGERFDLQRALAAGLAQDQFVLHYQPRVELGTLRVTGVEALLRWKRPGHGLVPARQIIELAEESDLIHDLGQRVLDDACARARQWQERGVRLRMAVNVSTVQLGDPDLAARVAAALANQRLDPDVLELELGEAGVMRTMESSAEALRQLKQLGVRLSLDGFGTAYSSLGYLARLAPAVLKIAPPLVAAIDQDPTRAPTDAGLLRAIVALGKSLAATVVAGGVETGAQHRFLRLVGCDAAQGFLYGRPQPADRLEPLLTRGRVELEAAPE